MARKPEEYDNSKIKRYMLENGYGGDGDYFDLPRWMDDVFSGAAGQISGTQKFSPPRLWRLLCSLDIVSTESVKTAMNRKRLALGDEPISDRYAQYVCKALRCASQALSYHKDKNECSVARAENSVVDFAQQMKFTDIELDMIREAAKKGSDHYKKCISDIMEIRSAFCY